MSFQASLILITQSQSLMLIRVVIRAAVDRVCDNIHAGCRVVMSKIPRVHGGALLGNAEA